MDDWLSADNTVAVLTALLGVAVSFGVVWYERRVPRRKRIGYRVQMDTPIGNDDPDGEGDGAPNVRLGLFNDLDDMNDATLVLLRIENDGGESIAEHDYTNRDPNPALTVVFSGRTVRGVAITQSNARHLRDHFVDVRHSGSQIHLPRVPLNRGQYFKLLVALNRGHVGDAVRIDGNIRDGDIVPNAAVPVDSKPPRFSRSARLITILLTVCVTVLAGIIVAGEDAPPPWAAPPAASPSSAPPPSPPSSTTCPPGTRRTAPTPRSASTPMAATRAYGRWPRPPPPPSPSQTARSRTATRN